MLLLTGSTPRPAKAGIASISSKPVSSALNERRGIVCQSVWQRHYSSILGEQKCNFLSAINRLGGNCKSNKIRVCMRHALSYMQPIMHIINGALGEAYGQSPR